MRWLSRDRSPPTQPHPFSLLLHMTLSALTSCSPMGRNSVARHVHLCIKSSLTSGVREVQAVHLRIKSSLTSGVREVQAVLSSFPAVWASPGAFLMFIQAGLAVHPPKACHLVWAGRYEEADLTHQFVWWCVHKLAVISTSLGSMGSHQIWLEICPRCGNI